MSASRPTPLLPFTPGPGVPRPGGDRILPKRRARRLRPLLATLLMATVPLAVDAQSGPSVDRLVDGWIEGWKRFHPTRAWSQGFLGLVGELEDRSPRAIEGWIELNRSTLASIDALDDRGDLTLDQRIDLRLLRTAVRTELLTWTEERPHAHSLDPWLPPLGRAVRSVVESPILSTGQKARLALRQLGALTALADAARAAVADGSRAELAAGIEQLEELRAWIADELPDSLAEALPDARRDAWPRARDRALVALDLLTAHLRLTVLPQASAPEERILGREAYARRLALYTDSDLTPERLETLARREIDDSRRALDELAKRYLTEARPELPLPTSAEERIARAFEDMEADRPETEQEYLERLRGYAADVERFVRENEIATVPAHQTLSLELAPESAGPMTRIGYVDSAPPFHPNPWTVWYLATIPDSFPEEERILFWRSFNYPFKRFIVIHELFPGHYMQLKLLRESPHPIRILFPYGPFTEGWATFTERVVLDAGYAEGDLLTRLAQQRKRLENANRAYTSVQVHCHGWNEQQVVDFSIGTSLLAPQFASSLWGRLTHWPMQITSYMLGGLQLDEVYEHERRRLGSDFSTRRFMDTVLRTGPIPADLWTEVLAVAQPAD